MAVLVVVVRVASAIHVGLLPERLVYIVVLGNVMKMDVNALKSVVIIVVVIVKRIPDVVKNRVAVEIITAMEVVAAISNFQRSN
ncbi:hypothetical protein DRN58_07425 [Thermococci archaeon]|nr:MAG: hypothetical protein DRN58_07425 [Thermococci archaeon]